MPAVVAEGLVKRFGETEALRGVDLEIERAKVLGVLGPNGAGKTTTVRLLTTLLKPDAGRAILDGIDVVEEPRRARARIGLTGQPRSTNGSPASRTSNTWAGCSTSAPPSPRLGPASSSSGSACATSVFGGRP